MPLDPSDSDKLRDLADMLERNFELNKKTVLKELLRICIDLW